MRLLILITFLFQIPIISLAEVKMKPLEHVIGAEDSVQNRIYVSERCAAVYGTVANRMKNSGRNDVASLVKTLEDSMVLYVSMALIAAEEAGMKDTYTMDAVAKEVMDIMKLYIAETNNNYAATGNAIEGIVKEDMLLCKSILN